jgi:hypothetical protein
VTRVSRHLGSLPGALGQLGGRQRPEPALETGSLALPIHVGVVRDKNALSVNRRRTFCRVLERLLAEGAQSQQ